MGLVVMYNSWLTLQQLHKLEVLLVFLQTKHDIRDVDSAQRLAITWK